MAPWTANLIGGLLLALTFDLTGGVQVRDQATVTTTATGYDVRSLANNGCFTDGCKPELTRDLDMDGESRWSCSTSISGVSECSITYAFSSPQTLTAVCIGFYLGDTRTRRFQIISEGTVITETEYSESGGQYLGLEEFFVDFKTTEVTILATPSSDPEEWFSLTEVIFLALEGDEIGDTSNTVAVSATGYDARTTSGCSGPCLPSNTREGDYDDDVSRWSCINSGATGGLCSITYDFSSSVNLNVIRMSFYKGDERQRSLEVYINGAYDGSFTSAGDTLEYENYWVYESGVTTVTLVALNLGTDWLSINNVDMYVS